MSLSPVKDEMRKLVDGLKNKGVLKTDRIADALMKVDRAEFCTEQMDFIGHEDAYLDRPEPIGY